MSRIVMVTALLIASGCGLLATARPGWADGPGQPRSTAGPPESRGCRLIVSMPKSSFESDDAVPIDFAVSNDSGRDVVMGECGLWQNHTVEVRDERGHRPPLTEVGDRLLRPFAPGTPRDEFKEIRLKPGERHRCTPPRSGTNDLSLLFRLEPGKYWVKVTHEDRRPPGGLRCSSDWRAFEIRSPRTVPTLELSLHRRRLRVLPPRTSFRRGEPIALDLTLFNASDRDVFIFLGGSFWNHHRIEVRAAHGQEAPLTELGARCRGLFSPGGAHDRGRTVPVRAGTRHGWGNDADLSTLFRLEPGKYQVRAIYAEQHPPGVLLCSSDWVDFEVEPGQAPAAPERGGRLELSVPKASFRRGEPIPAHYVKWNADDRAIVIWECGFWGNHILDVQDARGKQPPLTPMGEQCLGLFSHGNRDKNYPVVLEPGRQHGRKGTIADLSRYFRLDPGGYRVRLTYEDTDESGLSMRTCASNWVDFRVK